MRDAIDFVLEKAPHLVNLNLKESPLLDAMPVQKIVLEDNDDGTCKLTKHTFLLETSLQKIGFEKNESGAHVLVYDDTNTREVVKANLQALADFRGWELELAN